MKLTILNNEELNILCKTHEVENLYLFGSSLSENFHKESDIDFLVKFNTQDLFNYFNNYLSLKEKLAKLFNRKIDLVEVQSLKNPILINSINKTKQLIYG
ncbi:nucleotidyltransferase family protein [Halpernia sp.]|uniref:nucleotidyltransferase family protein n=1 Tax=Halpernia sp. TaxID=2782209 RepID=UPI003A91E36E